MPHKGAEVREDREGSVYLRMQRSVAPPLWGALGVEAHVAPRRSILFCMQIEQIPSQCVCLCTPFWIHWRFFAPTPTPCLSDWIHIHTVSLLPLVVSLVKWHFLGPLPGAFFPTAPFTCFFCVLLSTPRDSNALFLHCGCCFPRVCSESMSLTIIQPMLPEMVELVYGVPEAQVGIIVGLLAGLPSLFSFFSSFTIG